MAVSLRARRWRRTTQPTQAATIDWANPLTRGLSLLVNLGGGQHGFDAVTGGRNVIVGTKGARGLYSGLGMGTSVGVSGSDRINTPLVTDSVQRSYLAVAKIRGTGGGALGRVMASTNLGIYYDGGYGGISYQINYSNGNLLVTLFPYVIGTTFSTAIGHDGTLGSTMPAVALDGRMVVPTSRSTTTGVRLAPGVLSIGNVATSIRGMDGDVYLTAVWDRLLSRDELIEVSRNPWQLFIPASQYDFRKSGNVYYFGVVEAGAAADGLSSTRASDAAAVETGAAVDAPASARASSTVTIEAGAAADVVASLRQTIAAMVEAGAAADVSSAAGQGVLAVGEAGTAADTASATGLALAGVTEAGDAEDAAAAAGQGVIAIAEAVAASDLQAAVAQASAAVAEAGDAAEDAQAATAQATAQVEEAEDAQDAPATTLRTSAAVVEAGVAVDLVTPALFHGQSISENLQAIDSTSSILATMAALVEIGQLLELESAGAASSAALVEAGTVSDDLDAALDYAVDLQDDLDAEDLAATLATFIVDLSDGLLALDEVRAVIDNNLPALHLTAGYLTVLKARQWRTQVLLRNWITRK